MSIESSPRFNASSNSSMNSQTRSSGYESRNNEWEEKLKKVRKDSMKEIGAGLCSFIAAIDTLANVEQILKITSLNLNRYFETINILMKRPIKEQSVHGCLQ